jgi:hypothetical protein
MSGVPDMRLRGVDLYPAVVVLEELRHVYITEMGDKTPRGQDTTRGP